VRATAFKSRQGDKRGRYFYKGEDLPWGLRRPRVLVVRLRRGGGEKHRGTRGIKEGTGREKGGWHFFTGG